MRLCLSLTVVGGILVVAGLATGLVGETLRLAGRYGWHPIVLVAEIFVALGMSCGMSLVAAVAGWHLSIKWRYPPDQRATHQRATDQRATDQRATDQRATGKRATDQRATDKRPASATGPNVPMGVAASQPAADMTGSQPPVDTAYFGGRDVPSSEPRVTRPRPVPEVANPSVPPGYADQKMTQIKELYREAEEMGDAEFSAHWEELRQRQYELITQYYEQVGLGGADVGHSVADRRPLWRRLVMPAALRPRL